MTHPSRPCSQEFSSAADINTTLNNICVQLDANPGWKGELDYVVRKKSGEGRLDQIWKYQGPDDDTFALLENFRETWTNQPMTFLSFGKVTLGISDHPVVQAALRCLSSELNDAWSTMLRRCECIVLSMVQKHFRTTVEDIVLRLAPFNLDYSYEVLFNKIKSFLSAGSRYEWLEGHLGHGVIFVLGKTIANDVWEVRLRKYSIKNDQDNTSLAAIQYLKSTGIATRAAQHRDMRDAIIRCLLTKVLEVCMPPPEAWSLADGIVFGVRMTVTAHHQMADDQMWAQSVQLHYSDPESYTW